MNAMLIGSTQVSFLGDLAASDKQDIQDCLLYAELQAGAIHTERGFTWLSHYQHALLRLGLTLQSYIVERELLISNAHQVRMYKVEVAGVRNSQRMADALGAAFEAMPLERDALMYLSEQAGKGRSSNFQCAPCEKTDEGRVLVFLCGLQLTCDATGGARGSRFVRLNSKGGGFVFDRTAYAKRRQEVQDVLRERGTELVNHVEL